MKDFVALDLFAGAGGATAGLRKAGFRVAAAVELDHSAAATYRANHRGVKVYESDILSLDPADVLADLGLARGDVAILQACPPCQTWSSLARYSADDPRNGLIAEVGRWLSAVLPNAFILENVPGVRRDERFAGLRSRARRLGYGTRAYIVNAEAFGVPQRRRRLILVGVRGIDGRSMPRRLESAFRPALRHRRHSAAPVIARASQAGPNDPLQVVRAIPELVRRRLEAIPPGGNRFDLPADLQLACHTAITDRRATSSYGRIPLRGPAATLTTRCTTPASGAFAHPIESRPITLREAALLQTFPLRYRFEGRYREIERQIGNAIPVRLARGVAEVVQTLIRQAQLPSSSGSAPQSARDSAGA